MALIDVRIEQVLAQRGRAFEWLVKQTNIPYARLMRINRGTIASLRLDTLAKLCRALEGQPGDILRLSESGTESFSSRR